MAYPNNLELSYAMQLLGLLVESTENYIEDGSWLEPLTDDIKNAKQALKKYHKLINKELSK